MKLTDEQISENYRAEIRQFMQNHEGLNVNSWSKKAGIRETTLRNFLNGHSESITIVTLKKLAQSIGVSVGSILGEEPDPANKPQTPYLRELMIDTIILAHKMHKNNALKEEDIAEFAADCYEGFLKDEAEDLKSYMRAYNRAKTG